MTDGGLVPVTLRVLRLAGWRAARIQAGTARGGAQRLAEAGWPDVIGLAPDGRVVLVECKREDGKLRQAQVEMATWCGSRGFEYRVLRSAEDLEHLVLEHADRPGEGRCLRNGA